MPVPNLARIERILARLDAVTLAEDMNLPGYRFHGLQGKPQRHAVDASGNHRITFGWDEAAGDAIDVDIEDYHRELNERKRIMTRMMRPVHPGEILREDVLPALGKSKAEIARLLGVSRQSLYDVLNEKQPVTTGMALRFAKLTGTTAESWGRMQLAFDLQVNAARMAEQLAAIPTLKAA